MDISRLIQQVRLFRKKVVERLFERERRRLGEQREIDARLPGGE